jgi:hypothetical protein
VRRPKREVWRRRASRLGQRSVLRAHRTQCQNTPTARQQQNSEDTRIRRARARGGCVRRPPTPRGRCAPLHCIRIYTKAYCWTTPRPARTPEANSTYTLLLRVTPSLTQDEHAIQHPARPHAPQSPPPAPAEKRAYGYARRTPPYFPTLRHMNYARTRQGKARHECKRKALPCLARTR